MSRFDRYWLRVAPWLAAVAAAAWGFNGWNSWKLGHHGLAALDWAAWAVFAWLTWVHCGKIPCALAHVDAHVRRATNDPMSRSSTTFNTSCPCPHCQGAMEELRLEGERRAFRLLHLAPVDAEARKRLREQVATMLKFLDQFDAQEKSP